jgi:polysaccharide export outer membrane protein
MTDVCRERSHESLSPSGERVRVRGEGNKNQVPSLLAELGTQGQARGVRDMMSNRWVAAAAGLTAGLLVLQGQAMAREFIVGQADVIAITVLDNKDMDVIAAVGPDGTITMPIVGGIKVEGLTLSQIAEKVKAEVSKTVKDPLVQVFLRDVNSYVVYFLGRVGRVGPLVNKRETNLLQAISSVGGVSPDADLTKAYLVRGNERAPINFVKLLKEGDVTHNIVLEPGDIIVFPEDEKRDVYLMGEVRAPGPLPVNKDRPLTVLTAIALGRGFSEFASPGRAVILRGNGSARVTIPVDIKELLKKPEAARDPALEPGDILLVPRGLF